jgi:hypothetical protein
MIPAKLQLKIFTAKGTAHVAAEELIPVFHGWIKRSVLPELLVDVANYAHVPEGPGVVLIGHENDYGIDDAEGRQGLLYNRKRQGPAPADRLADAFRRALNAAVLLEGDAALAGKLVFDPGQLLLRCNDRLAAPSDAATEAAVRPELEALCARLYGPGKFALTRVGEPRQLFGIAISAGSPPPLVTLLERAGGTPKAL